VSIRENPIPWYALERVLAALAAATCLVVTVIIWASVSQQQDMWPLPAMYFVEVVAASLLGLWGIYRKDAAGRWLAWATAGALFGFTILGALSVGFFYLPVAGLLGLAALWQDRQAWRRLPLHLGLALLLAAVAQAAVMLQLIRVLYPNAVF
jgi:hypothetical protein